MSRERGREVEKQDVLTKLAELRENSNEADSAASLMIEAVRRSLLASKSSICSQRDSPTLRVCRYRCLSSYFTFMRLLFDLREPGHLAAPKLRR